jgi:hypothetical protein
MKSSPSNIACIALCLGLFVALSGCSTFNHSMNPVLPVEEKAPSQGIYQVEMTGAFNKKAVFQGEIDGPLTVQSALERSGALDRFRNMDIEVYRVVKESNRGLKLNVSYDGRSKTVTPDYDYALHPNDRIVVTSKTNSALDKLVDSFNPMD